MRYIQLRIVNYRGIDASEVKFGASGITLVQGSNEAGKTSLGEAIGILFDYPDSSKNRIVEAIRPVHRDDGPEIELQAESGPYAFRYFKRFYKKPETRLTITRPKPESLTGRQAHERAEAILRETLDIDLWKALSIQQGDAIQQPTLTKQTSLSAALDKAAGGRPADPREESVYERVRGEYGLYFTEKGAEKKDLQEARRLQEETKIEIADIEKQIRNLDQDIEQSVILQREQAQLKKQEDEQEKTVHAHTSTLEEISALERALEETRLKWESAKKSEQAARRDKDERQGLIAVVQKATKNLEDLQKSSEMSLLALNKAEEELKNAQAIFNQADKSRKEADTLAALRRADYDYYNNKLHLEQLKERKERIDEARKKAAAAEGILAQNKVDTRALNAVQEAERRLLAANAQLETGAPSVHLRGLAECNILINDSATILRKDEVRTISIADNAHVTIPEALDIEITAGSSSEGLSSKVGDTRRALERVCIAVGVHNPDEARKAFEERREALRLVDNKGQIEKENLRDLTYEQIESKCIGIQHSVSEYLTKRTSAPIICSDLETAKRERTTAEDTQKKVNGEWEAARESVDSTRNVRDELSTKHQEVRVQLDMLAKDLNHARENLERVRKAVPDEMLDGGLADATRSMNTEESNMRAADSSLRAKYPERVKALAEAAKGSLKTTRNRRSDVHTELTEVQTRLKIYGEDGLHEKLHSAQSRYEHMETDNLALFRRASAAKYLLEALREEREKARRAYVLPLKEKIEQLGRLIFNDSFQVEINEDLMITSRTVNDVTVPFISLSGGTKEQLSLIFRLACSMIVAKDGGAPLILDDALGYTDKERLQMMGAALAKAAKECQIIIFTCVPERYSNVGEASIIPLK